MSSEALSRDLGIAVFLFFLTVYSVILQMIVWSHTKCALLNILSAGSERVEIERPCLTYLCVNSMHLSSRSVVDWA